MTFVVELPASWQVETSKQWCWYGAQGHRETAQVLRGTEHAMFQKEKKKDQTNYNTQRASVFNCSPFWDRWGSQLAFIYLLTYSFLAINSNMQWISHYLIFVRIHDYFFKMRTWKWNCLAQPYKIWQGCTLPVTLWYVLGHISFATSHMWEGLFLHLLAAGLAFVIVLNK